MAGEKGKEFNRRDFFQLLAVGSMPLLSNRLEASGLLSSQELVSPTPLHNADWPVLKEYSGPDLRKVALPLGGIGTGVVSLGGRGDLRDWEIVNRPAKGFAPRYSFFSLFAQPAGEASVTRVLEGPVDLNLYEGAFGATAPNHGLPRFDRVRFATAYPLAQVVLEDPSVPLNVRIEAFNPLIPGDVDASGLPVAVLRFVLENKRDKEVSASICGSLENFIGTDGTQGRQNKNKIRFSKDTHVQGLMMTTDGVPEHAEQWGTMALTTTAESGVTYSQSWGGETRWNTDLDGFWNDFSSDGTIQNQGQADINNPVGSLAVSVKLPARESKTITFMLFWHFPNRRTWTPSEDGGASEDRTSCDEIPDCVGNYYTTQYEDAWEAATRITPSLPALEEKTVTFVQSFCTSDLPLVVKEAALFNLSTLRSQTVFRIIDGHFFGFEGCGETWGCCHGSCTHVWNYEQATAFLFGDMARLLREVEFQYATGPDGLMSFRVNLPLSKSRDWGTAAADGQMGTIMKMYRDWQLSGDRQMLETLWPNVKKALAFAWIDGGWDADQDGVMEGVQHNTMDVEYFGPNPQMQFWYLGALRAASEMADYLEDTSFASKCRRLYENGRRWTDENLFNGSYYEHEIRAPDAGQEIAPALMAGMGATDLTRPDFQLGKGCLVDQLVGQFMAHVCGLGHLCEEEHIKTTLKSIKQYNFVRNLSGHFNNMRTFALGDEAGLLMASYPFGGRPEKPFPYYNEIMTGFEYAANVHMLYEGFIDDGLASIKAIRNRYDGQKRNPFNEAECGNHYARAMASWAAVLALTGFQYSGVDGTLQLKRSEKPVRWFWSNGSAWGTVIQIPGAAAADVFLSVLNGTMDLSKLTLRGFGSVSLDEETSISEGQSIRILVQKSDDE